MAFGFKKKLKVSAAGGPYQQYSQSASVSLATHHQGCYCGTCGGQYSGVAGYISGCFCASCVQPQRQPNAQVYNVQHGYGSGFLLGSTAIILGSSGMTFNSDLPDSHDATELEELRDRVKFLEMEVSEEEQKLIEVIRREKITAEELEMLVSLKRIQI